METVSYPSFSLGAQKQADVKLNPAVFGLTDSAQAAALVKDTVVWQLQKRRAGTHSTLTKGEMKGGNQKPWNQKGTGRARAGSNTSPLWVGGGIVFGPKPRNYETRLSKRSRIKALASVLSQKTTTQELVVLGSLGQLEPKTKQIKKLLEELIAGACPNDGKQTGKGKTACDGGIYIVLPVKPNEADSTAIEMLVKGARNLEGVVTTTSQGINVYDLLRHRYVVIAADAVRELEDRITTKK